MREIVSGGKVSKKRNLQQIIQKKIIKTEFKKDYSKLAGCGVGRSEKRGV